MELNQENYFNHPDYLHTSSLKVYLESKKLYKLRHIDKNPEYQFEETDAVLVGKIADELLTEGKTKYAEKVLKRDDEELFERQKLNPEFVATPSVWKKANIIADQLPKHPIWQQLKNDGAFQKIINGEMYGMKVCGKLDAFIPNVGLFDLKCTTEACTRTPEKWKWHCIDMGWDMQASNYTFMEGNNLPFYHLACWVKNGLLHVKLFKVSPDLLESGAEKTARAIQGILKKDFSEELISLSDAIDLGGMEPIINEEEDNGSF